MVVNTTAPRALGMGTGVPERGGGRTRAKGDGGKAEAVTREVRACFNRPGALGDAPHRDLRMPAAMRAMMERPRRR
jgi:hypothetical protein